MVYRPVLRYYGGKWRLASWIIRHFPAHKTYVEPFGGAASVLLRKKRSYAEVYNDLDSDVVNLFRILRDPEQASELIRQLRLTPYAREEFNQTYQTYKETTSPIERARRLIFRSFAGFGTTSTVGKWRTGFRSDTSRRGSTPSHDWEKYPDALNAVVMRLQGVIIEHDDAISVIRRYDGPDTLFYVDPPYPSSTRTHWGHNGYRHEMVDADHERLAAVLHTVQGSVVISSYESDLYQHLYADYRRVETKAYADGARPRTEVLWLSPDISLPPPQLPLFEWEDKN